MTLECTLNWDNDTKHVITIRLSEATSEVTVTTLSRDGTYTTSEKYKALFTPETIFYDVPIVDIIKKVQIDRSSGSYSSKVFTASTTGLCKIAPKKKTMF